MRYAVDKDKVFRTIEQRIQEYLVNTNQTRFANNKMYKKVIIQFLVFFVTYALILSNNFHGIDLFLLQVLNGCFQFFIAVGIAHDASHGAFSKHKKINQFFSKTFDLIGIDSKMWNYNHVIQHHSFPNVPKEDAAIDSFLFFRFHPEVKHNSIMRFQHIYIIGIYCIATLYKWFLLDFISLVRKVNRERKLSNIKDIINVFVKKGILYSHALIVPMYFVDVPWYQYLFGFLFFQVINGLFIGLIFQVTHLNETTHFVYPKDNKVKHTYLEHVLFTTADFSTENPFVTWISGGLNLHVAHHLFPGYCQMHLPKMTKIVKDVCRENNLPYREFDTMFSAFNSHRGLLKSLGESQIDKRLILS